MGLQAVKKSGTLIGNIGNGSAITNFVLASTDVGARLNTGSTSQIKDSQTTSTLCNVGDVIKYVNICLEICARGITTYPDAQDNGWLEYAIIKQKETDITPTTTNLSIKTLGDIATQIWRGDCLWTGCVPVGAQQPNSLDIKIKVPKIVQKFQQGTQLRLLFFFRSSNVADVRTDSHRFVVSTMYKCYG